jgi:hypothetical protein
MRDIRYAKRFPSVVMALLLACTAGPAHAVGKKIHFGPKAGMMATVVAATGLDTSRALIRTKHTREDKAAFCLYQSGEGKVTSRCLRGVEPAPGDRITANCLTGEFTDFGGRRFRFAGPSRNKEGFDLAPKYSVIDVEEGHELDAASASHYDVNLHIFKALCPRHAPADVN